ncbi:MAG: phasin family protein [Planctomycetes bacterium]|nr:phasin family protein [Planctomycetota bacterium]
MIELIKKTLLAGVGLAALTKDKVEELARDIAKSAELSSEKGQQFVDEITKRAEKAREELEASVRRLVNDNLSKTDLPTREDIHKLMARIDELEQKLTKPST